MTTDGAPARGRPRGFDEDEVLERVMELFWERGFECSSLADIVDAAELNKSSLYNAFGSKDELFHRALERYLEFRMGMLEEMSRGAGGLDDLLAIIEFMRAEVTGPCGGRGCLGINSSTEVGNGDEWMIDYGNRYRTMMRASFRRVLDRAADLGEIDPGLVDVYTDTMNGLAMSLTVTARSGAPPDELNRIIDSTSQLVGTWRRGS